jgi:hypothetical protein
VGSSPLEQKRKAILLASAPLKNSPPTSPPHTTQPIAILQLPAELNESMLEVLLQKTHLHNRERENSRDATRKKIATFREKKVERFLNDGCMQLPFIYP